MSREIQQQWKFLKSKLIYRLIAAFSSVFIYWVIVVAWLLFLGGYAQLTP